MTVGYMIGVVLRRVFMGAFSAFIVMLVVGRSSEYLGLMPSEPEATRYATWLFFAVAFIVAILGLVACKIALLSVPLFALVAGIILSVHVLQTTGLTSDLNGDGIFTIRDFVMGVFGVVVATGSYYLTIFGSELTPTVATFFEVPISFVEVPAKIVLTLFWWGIFVFGWAQMIVSFALSDLQTEDN